VDAEANRADAHLLLAIAYVRLGRLAKPAQRLVK
jgi:hypothetical protein